MKEPTVDSFINDNSIAYRINSERSSLISRLYLGFFAITGFLIPIIVFVSCLLTDMEIGFGFIISIAIGFGVGFYLTRLILWNTFGAEYIHISSEGLYYHCDYKYFKDNKKTLTLNDLELEMIITSSTDKSQNSNDSKGLLILKNPIDKIETNIELTKNELIDMIDKMTIAIEKYCN